MKLKVLLSLPLLLSLGLFAHAQLPDSMNDWVTRSSRPITAADIQQFAGNDAAVVLEYGFASGEHREYENNGATLSVNLWKMKEPTGAYGLYTFYRDPGTATMDAGGHVAIWPNRLLIQRGSYVIDATGAKLSLGEGRLLLSKIPQLKNAESVGTELPGFLPEQGMVPQTLKFVTGPVAFARLVKVIPAGKVGFDTGAEAEVAEYAIAGRKVRLLLIGYETPQIAAKKLREFQQLVGAANSEQANGIFFQRKGSVLGLTLDAPSPAVAENLLQDIQHETQVTWNQYVPSRRDNIGQLIVNVFLLAGFVLLFSLVAGLSLGGARILAKKFLPIPIFDRPSQIEIIQLHLSDR